MNKKGARFLIVVAFCLLAVTVILYAWWLAAKWPHERRTLKSPFGDRTSALAATPFWVKLSPELIASGVKAKRLGATIVTDRSDLFFRIETVHIYFELFTTKQSLARASLSYVLQDNKGRDVGVGQLILQGDLKQHDSEVVTIVDARALDADGILLFVNSGR
jgi:hypothetical protein